MNTAGMDSLRTHMFAPFLPPLLTFRGGFKLGTITNVFIFSILPDTGHLDPFHSIGHLGWYERAFKPLRVVPLEPYPDL